MKCLFHLCETLIVLLSLRDSILSALPIENGIYPLNNFGRRLIIKPFPGIENLQSDLYEVFMEPYGYVS